MLPILIVGAGPVGCTVALYLARKDIPVVLIEAEDAIPKDLRASTFHPPTLDKLSELGIVDDMKKVGLIVPDYQYRDRKTNEVAKFELAVLKDETDHPYRLQCEQFKMAAIAVEKLKEFDHADVRFGTRFSGYRETGGSVEALVFDGTEEQRIECSFLVGCDGAGSSVRKSSGVMFKGMTYPERFLVVSTTFDFSKVLKDLSLVNYISDPDEWCVLLSTLGMWRVLVPTPLDQPEEMFLTDAFIQDRLQRLAKNNEDFDILHRTLYHVHQRVAETYRVGDRAVVAGDAAHINNPLGGMGMNGGVQDAFNLAEKLTQIIHDGADYGDSLDLYDRQRRGICEQFVQEHTKKNKALMEATEETVQRTRQAKFMKDSADPKLAKAFLMETSMINCLRDSYLIS